MTVQRTPPKVPRPAPAPLANSPRIAELTARLDHARAGGPEALGAAVDGFWEGPGARSPLFEPVLGCGDERIVTFLWRDDDAAEVLLFVNRLTDERNLSDSLMRRIPGTDIWHLSYRMGWDWRASYSYLTRGPGELAPWRDGDDQVAVRRVLDRGRADPRNPAINRNRAGVVQSVVEAPGAPPQPWLVRRDDIPHGAVTRIEGPGGRTLWTYLAPGDHDRPLPLLIVLDGDVWTSAQDLPNTLDNLIAARLVPPLAAVLVDSGGREQRWADLDRDSRFEDYLAHDLLDWAREALPISRHPAEVVVAGQSLGGLTALKTVLRHAGRIGVALSQSASLWQQDLGAGLAGRDLSGVRAYLEVGTQEWVLLEPNRELAGSLREAGAMVDLVEYNGGHDYACWRGGIADGLRELLGP